MNNNNISNFCHKVERVDNLMYRGCEPHWHCVLCGDYWPFHCYSKNDLEQMACKALTEEQHDNG